MRAISVIILLAALLVPSGHASGSPPSDLSAEELQTQAAQGDAKAQFSLGLLYYYGQGVSQDYATARQWWEKAAAQGHARAQNALGLLYVNGLSVPQDSAKARQWWEKAAAQGDAKAQLSLGVMYDKGQGVPQDYAQAAKWYEKAAAQGNAEAQLHLGVLYAEGHGVPQDYAKARQWWEKAAAQGDAEAQLNLGIMYATGEGVPQDFATAWGWYEKAAAQGLAQAQYNLGVMYVEGQGVSQDFATARGWYEKAAAQGDAMAQNALGLLYADGLSVPQDYVRAYMWLNVAAARLTGDAQKSTTDVRDEVARHMTPAQIAEAKRLSQQCQAQQFKGCNESDQQKFDKGLLQYIKLPIEKELVFPAVLWDGQRKGELLLGRTSLSEALQIVPPLHGHGPSPPTRSTAPGKVGKVLQKVKTGYNPLFTNFILIFDEHEKLVIIQLNLSSSETEQKMIRKILVEYQFQKVVESEAVTRMQGDIAPCITLDVFVPKMADSPVADMGFVFTCATD